ncbi:MAG: type II secretion system minor pseudopilin GspK [Burkholderiaceae bacterium]
MAIIGALVVVAAASVATANIMERQTLLADTLAGERDRVQAKWLLRSGLDWSRIILWNDARSNAVTLKDAIWAQPIEGLEIRAPGSTRQAYFSGLIEDEQGKYDIGRLAVNGTVTASELASLRQLLASLGLPDWLAPAIAARVASAQTGPQSEATAPGLRTVRDLLSIEGMTLETVTVVSEYLTVLPYKSPLNINTASAEVLSASIPQLDLAQARSLVEQRNRGQWFNSRGDFLNRLSDPKVAVDIQVDVRSEWFKVTGEVMLDHATASMQALLQRQGSTLPAVQWIEG